LAFDTWKALLPEIPEHLPLGKGCAVTTEDYLIVRRINFLGGSLADGVGGFTGLLGLSVCINRGICRAARRLPVGIPFAGARLRAGPAVAGQLN
jgi:hypothetical protein